MRRLAPLVLAALLPLAPATAQDTPPAAPAANGQAFGNWILRCQALGVAQTQCNLVQELTLAETGAMIVRLIVTELQGGPTLVAHVPIGAYLPSGLVYQVEGDETEQKEMVWQRCLGSICEGALAMDEDEVARLSSGTLLVGYRPAPGVEPVVLRVGLDGFGEGVAAIFGEG